MSNALKGSALGALVLAWWASKQGQTAWGWLDAGILVGLGLCWLLDRCAGGR